MLTSVHLLTSLTAVFVKILLFLPLAQLLNYSLTQLLSCSVAQLLSCSVAQLLTSTSAARARSFPSNFKGADLFVLRFHLSLCSPEARNKKPVAKADAGMRTRGAQPGVNSSTGFASGESPQCQGAAPSLPRRRAQSTPHTFIIARHQQSVNIFFATVFQIRKTGKNRVSTE